MAATNDGNKDRHQQWYDPDLEEVNPEIRSLLENYSKVPPADVVKHVNKINPYPCIGHYRFLNLTLLTHPLYQEIIRRLKSNPSSVYLDLGCCFGQDLRQLVQDGVPSSQLIGLDIEGPLMDLGYELFLDQKTMESKFLVADIFKGESQGEPWTSLVANGADVIHCSAFFHLFPLNEQIEAAKNIAQLVKKGGIIVGRQSGSVKPGEVPAIKPGSTSFRHDVETLTKMWDQVGSETGTKWKVEGSLDEVGMKGKKNPVEDENSRRLLFTITRLE
ncbi:hypothetical protein N7468_002749 [Penicillium chermesinum]|uniref:Methyltransferase type 12 domain-containing protein n=1 Tax=Penicillium chermesinum TaxID=63820 RepID=A0A9W9PKR9_9EURO|nr:uncharacterized protein N7468_002749 [Penicillium chermesinum]KAJ5247766.1 hypothetical protein N7468_002749 [Penicillium chermesinum]